tara:strand:- start:9093 stop:9374 length:282 start_codon:yes stop_codon:yes gene_type:complete
MPAAKKPPRPPAIIVQRDNPLKPAQVKDGLKQLGPDDALPMQALQHVIDQLLLAQINEVADPKTVELPNRMAHCSGGIDVLATLKSQLSELRA